jgi:hypothetical protein
LKFIYKGLFMKAVNLPTGAQRNLNSGYVFREVYNGSGGFTTELPFQHTVRVSAGANVTVSMDGVLCATLRTGEVEYFNTGAGRTDDRSTVTLVIGAGDARVQIGEEKDPGRRTR